MTKNFLIYFSKGSHFSVRQILFIKFLHFIFTFKLKKANCKERNETVQNKHKSQHKKVSSVTWIMIRGLKYLTAQVKVNVFKPLITFEAYTVPNLNMHQQRSLYFFRNLPVTNKHKS